jgi:hypothetical protein
MHLLSFGSEAVIEGGAGLTTRSTERSLLPQQPQRPENASALSIAVSKLRVTGEFYGPVLRPEDVVG